MECSPSIYDYLFWWIVLVLGIAIWYGRSVTAENDDLYDQLYKKGKYVPSPHLPRTKYEEVKSDLFNPNPKYTGDKRTTITVNEGVVVVESKETLETNEEDF